MMLPLLLLTPLQAVNTASQTTAARQRIDAMRPSFPGRGWQIPFAIGLKNPHESTEGNSL